MRAPRRAPTAFIVFMTTDVPAPPTALYLEWRRWLEEDRLNFGRRPGAPAHPCWASESGAPCIVQPSAAVPFYGCTECGRSHYCVAPYKTCPRLAPLHATHAVCAFSGRTLEAADDASAPGTYLEEGRLYTAAAEVGTMVHGGAFMPYTYTGPERLERQASAMSSATARKRLFRQADEMRAHVAVHRDIREIERLQRHRDPAPSAEVVDEKEDDEEAEEADEEDVIEDDSAEADLLPVMPDTYDEDSDSDREGGAIKGASLTVRLTREGAREAANEAAFLERYLDPVLRYVDDHAADFVVSRAAARALAAPPANVPGALILKRSRSDDGAGGSSKKQRTETGVCAGESYLQIEYQPPLLPWRRMHAGQFAATVLLLNHQWRILDTVRGVVRDVCVRAAAAAVTLPPPTSCEAYTLRIDRALMLFNWRCAVKERIAVDEAAPLVRAVVMLLTSVFSADCCFADASGLVLPVWLADPFLEAAERANLLHLPLPSAASETAAPISRERAPIFVDALQNLSLSPQRLAAFLHDDNTGLGAADFSAWH